MRNLKLINHPLVEHYLSILRDKETDHINFKFCLDKVSYLIASEVFSSLPVKRINIETPIKKTKGFQINDDVILLPILRAGLGLLTGFMELFPKVRTGHIGLYRNEETLEPIKYYYRFPAIKDKRKVFIIIVDPMLATGGSTAYTIKQMLENGYRKIAVASLLAAPEGINHINKQFKSLEQQITIYTCSLDEKLNELGYIVPGLGDAGDRLFGTI